MKEYFDEIFANAKRRDGVELSVELIGERPCMGDVDLDAIGALTEDYRQVVLDVMGKEITSGSSSTDCNIPLSLGVPALCVGVFLGKGTHTREESIEKASFPVGAEVGLRYLLKLFDLI